MEEITLEKIAKLVEGQLQGNPDHVVTGVNSLDLASQEDLSFFSDPHFNQDFEKTQAGAILVSPDIKDSQRNLIHVEDPSLAFDQIVASLLPEPRRLEPGIHATAVVDPAAQIHPEACVGPYCVVGPDVALESGVTLYSHVVLESRVKIGKNTTLWPFVCVREDCEVGGECLIHPGVIIGFDGFGFNHVQGRWVKIPQRGTVVIGDGVEIGANTTIARARFGKTQIGEGTKIDAHVQVGHNVSLGRSVSVGALSGLGGTTQIQDGCIVAPMCGTLPHVKVASGSVLAGRTVVTKDIKKPGIFWGFPAIEHSKEKRRIMETHRIEKMRTEIKQLRERLEKLETSTND